jgi:hypothetical protein
VPFGAGEQAPLLHTPQTPHELAVQAQVLLVQT